MYCSTLKSPKFTMGMPAIVCAMACAIAPAHIAWAQSGACCVEGEGLIFCSEETEAQCAKLGGVFHGDGTVCDPFPCNIGKGPVGACCSPGTCFESTRLDCSATWLGPGTTCDPFPCEVPAGGACCLVDVDFCLDTDEILCGLINGSFHEGQTCADVGCGKASGNPEVGACCLLDPFGISCATIPEELCAKVAGVFQGVDSTCDPLPCDPGTGPVGACCIKGGGLILCSQLHESHCAQLGGVFQGADTVCDPNPCVPPGDGNADGEVNITDLLMVIETWGPCPSVGSCPTDSNNDDLVNIADLLTVVANWS
ncbi:MAG: hypothetical protein L0Y44_02795 [Phycisphaerales bacterium]|nr:hypothetical protein [Phycisphaerales bacterium]MCI0629565.1 hypothetical protein [Phycisphaerales bacterium]